MKSVLLNNSARFQCPFSGLPWFEGTQARLKAMKSGSGPVRMRLKLTPRTAEICLLELLTYTITMTELVKMAGGEFF